MIGRNLKSNHVLPLTSKSNSVLFYRLLSLLLDVYMKHQKPVILALLIAVLSSFSPLHINICYGDKPSSDIVDNLYSSVVLITHKKLKTSVWEALRFAAFVAGQVAGTGSFGVGSSVPPVHTEKNIGTGFQTKWGSHNKFSRYG